LGICLNRFELDEELNHEFQLTTKTKLVQQLKSALNVQNHDYDHLKLECLAITKRIQSLTRTKHAILEEINIINEINDFDLSPLESEKETSLNH
jgi:hypothetical protein